MVKWFTLGLLDCSEASVMLENSRRTFLKLGECFE
jgi:hypothetical protein